MSKAYHLQLTIPKTIFFRANDLVRVVIQPKSAATPPWNGLYYVGQVVYFVDKNSVMANVDFYRGEYTTINNTFTPLAQLGESVVQPQRSAKGHDPNLVSVASSVLTRGSGNTVSRSRLLDTQNPSVPVQPAG